MIQFYKELGITPGASNEEIKRAYKKLAQMHHPDKGGDPVRFTNINNAYTQLVKQRKGLKSVLRKQQKKPIRAKVKVDISIVALGGDYTVGILSGTDSFEATLCIPAGAADRDVIRYPNLGPLGQDLYIEIEVLPSPFTQSGNDLILEHHVPLWELLLGRTVIVPGINKSFELVIPKLELISKTFKIPGAGIQTRPPGNLLVKIKPILPKTITPELKEAILNEINFQKAEDDSKS